MFNFINQLDEAKGCPDIWLNIILCVSETVFLDEMNNWTNGLWVKQIALQNVGGPRPVQLKAWME